MTYHAVAACDQGEMHGVGVGSEHHAAITNHTQENTAPSVGYSIYLQI